MLANEFRSRRITRVAAIEARGFIVGAPLALSLQTGFVPVRKAGKLPGETIDVHYELEYGTDQLEIHRDAVKTGDRVIVVDDLVATGGTAMAAISLIRQLGAEVIGFCSVIDLPDLGGSTAIRDLGIPVHTIVEFSGH
jgi:adenine phosphoribosyltransferase